MKNMPEIIQRCQTGYFLKVDPVYGQGVASWLGLKIY